MNMVNFDVIYYDIKLGSIIHFWEALIWNCVLPFLGKS